MQIQIELKDKFLSQPLPNLLAFSKIFHWKYLVCAIYIFKSKFTSEYFTHSHLLLLNILHGVLKYLYLSVTVAFTFLQCYFML